MVRRVSKESTIDVREIRHHSRTWASTGMGTARVVYRNGMTRVVC